MANYDDTNGVWRTIGGRRVFIKTGQSLSEAMKESGKFTKKQIKKKEDYVVEPGKAKKESAEQIEKDFPDNLSDAVKEQARLLNTRSYDDIDDVVDDFAEEQGISRTEAKYALLKDEFKQRQGAYMDAREDGSYSDAELNHMEAMAKDSYFKLQEAQEQLDSFNEDNKKAGNILDQVSKSNKEYAKKKAEEYRSTKDPMFQDIKEERAREYERQAGATIQDKYEFSEKELEKKYGKEYVEAEKRRLKKWEKHNDVAQMEKEFAEAQKQISSKSYKASDLEEGKPYEIDMGNGIKKTAIYLGKDTDGNSAFYDGEGVGGTFAFSDKFINENVKVSDNKDDQKFMDLHAEIRNRDSNREHKTKINSPLDVPGRISENKDLAEQIIADDEWNDIQAHYYGGTNAEIVNERTGKRVKITPYDNRETLSKKIEESYKAEKPKRATDEDINHLFNKTPHKTAEEKNSLRKNEWIQEEGGVHTKVDKDGTTNYIQGVRKGDGSHEYTRTDYDKSGKEIHSATYKSLEEAQAGSKKQASNNDFERWKEDNNEKIASYYTTTYSKDLKNINNDIWNSIAKDIYDEEKEPEKINKGSNDWIRNAYNEYKKEHPKSKLTLADFTRKNKK